MNLIRKNEFFNCTIHRSRYDLCFLISFVWLWFNLNLMDIFEYKTFNITCFSFQQYWWVACLLILILCNRGKLTFFSTERNCLFIVYVKYIKFVYITLSSALLVHVLFTKVQIIIKANIWLQSTYEMLTSLSVSLTEIVGHKLISVIQLMTLAEVNSRLFPTD